MKGEAAALSQATYYEVLCVERTAMLAAIKKAYYRFANNRANGWRADSWLALADCQSNGIRISTQQRAKTP